MGGRSPTAEAQCVRAKMQHESGIAMHVGGALAWETQQGTRARRAEGKEAKGEAETGRRGELHSLHMGQRREPDAAKVK